MITPDSLHMDKELSAEGWIRETKASMKQFCPGLKSLGGRLSCDLLDFFFTLAQEPANISFTE